MKALQTLNVYSGDYGICLAQKFIEEKTNEIPAAQETLRLMDLEKTIVTADAINCQKETQKGRWLQENCRTGAGRGSHTGILHNRGYWLVQ